MMNMNEKKMTLRKELRQRVRSLTEPYKSDADAAITNRLLGTWEYQQAEVIFCYVGTADEIDTTPILSTVLKSGKTLVVPKCMEKGRMEAFRIGSLDELEEGAYGIMEPKCTCQRLAGHEISLAVIPCLSCTRGGIRLGYGGGYYDRYLETTSCRRIALCRHQILSDVLPKEPHDLAMDLVITENEVIICQKTPMQFAHNDGNY